MRFSLLASVALVGSAFAAPAPAQDITNVQFVLDAYKTILANAAQLTQKVTALKAGDNIPEKLRELSTISASTIAVTEKTTAEINKLSGKLSQQAAIQVAPQTVEVARTTVQIIDTLVTKKQLFVDAKVHKIVLDDLNHLFKVSEAFTAAAKAKVPTQFENAVNPYFKQLSDALQKGIQNFT